jgi:hypothetical protein
MSETLKAIGKNNKRTRKHDDDDEEAPPFKIPRLDLEHLELRDGRILKKLDPETLDKDGPRAYLPMHDAEGRRLTRDECRQEYMQKNCENAFEWLIDSRKSPLLASMKVF